MGKAIISTSDQVVTDENNERFSCNGRLWGICLVCLPSYVYFIFSQPIHTNETITQNKGKNAEGINIECKAEEAFGSGFGYDSRRRYNNQLSAFCFK
jgi:hypothetical protein